MRIESVYLKNLNSLRGEWYIDFEHPAYAQTGLFAITGPTGAGKTTVLDAIALALYARTPRLAGFSKNDNEIMTRGTGEAAAEVTFRAGGRRWRARWEQRRARSKSDGALQPAQAQLCEYREAEKDWQIVADKLRTTETEIPKITGMTFAQFTKTMLLAQGDFAAFLKADENERAEMLERITGTEIYSRISSAVHERREKEKSELKTLEDALARSGSMTAQERQVVEKELQEKNALSQNLGRELDAVKATLSKTAQAAETTKRLEQTRNALRTAKIQQSALGSTKEKIRRARLALALNQQGADIARQRNDIARWKAAAPKLASEREAADKALCKARAELDTANFQQNTVQKAYEHLISLTPRVRSLDQQLLKTKSDIEKKTTDVQSAQKKTDDAAKEICRRQTDLRSKEVDLQQLNNTLEKTAGDGAIAECLTNIAAALARWEAADAGLSERKTKKVAVEKRLAAARRAVEKEAPAVKKAQEVIVLLEQKISKVAAASTAALAGNSLGSLQLAHSKLQTRLADLTLLVNSARTLVTETEALRSSQKTLEHLREKLKTHQSHKADVDNALRLSLDAQASLQRQIDALSEIEKLADFRTRLTDGTPCPLCGAVHHPYAVNLPDTDATVPSKKLSLEKAKAKALEEEVRAAGAKCERASVHIETLERDMLKTNAALQEHQCSVASDMKRLNLAAEGDIVITAEVAKESAASKADAIAKRLEAAASATDELTRLTDERNVAAKALQLASDKSVKAEAELAAAQKDKDALTSEISEATEIVQKAAQVFLSLVSPMGEKADTVDEAENAANRLKKRANAFDENTTRSRALASEIERQKDALQTALVRQAEASDAAQAAQKELAQIKAQLLSQTEERSRLFGERSPDSEEAMAATQKATAEQALKTAQEACQSTLQAAQSAKMLEDANTAAIKNAAEPLATAEYSWSESLKRHGFTDEADWNAAGMETDAISTAEDEIKKANDSVTELLAIQSSLETEQSKLATELEGCEAEDVLRQKARELETQRTEVDKAAGRSAEQLSRDDAILKKNEETAQRIARQREVAMLWNQMHDLIGSHDGALYRRFVQGLTFERLVDLANQSLVKLTDRYELIADEGNPLTLNVIDNYRAGNIRSARNLSGGETFIVSLALALGLSHLSSRNVHVDSLFLDEGFGTLDETALDSALSVLASLNDEGKLIGIISHVGEIRERIPARIEVTPVAGGTSTMKGPGVSCVRKA